MTWFSPLLIRASAGTGKTFLLTTRYVKLLAEGESPSRILATTFTRKAAAEIRERVFVRIAKAVLDSAQAEELSRHIGSEMRGSEFWQEVLLRLIRAQDRLAICTLDSFCLRLAKSFAFELGIPFGWQLSDDAEERAQKLEAVGRVIAEEPHEELLNLIRLFKSGRLITAITPSLLNEVTELSELTRETTEDAWNWLHVPEAFGLTPLRELLSLLKKSVFPKTKEGKPLSFWEQARQRDLALLDSPDQFSWNEVLSKGICNAVLSGKTEFRGKDIPANVSEIYEQIIAYGKADLLMLLRGATLATHRLMSLYCKQVDALKHERGYFSFADIKFLVSSITGVETSLLYYRLDSQIRHILLDEFQDTSLAEWQVLEPIVEEILAQPGPEQSFFCVGDVKQAIYGWRGGVAEIFDRLREKFSILEERHLVKSYRSAPEIVGFVNQVFGELRENKALSNYALAVDRWIKGFERHSTEHENISGHIEFREVGEETDCYSEAVQIVKEIQKKEVDSTIGLLVRKNSAVAELVVRLQQAGIHASQEGGNPLVDSVAVTWILALLTFADHPGNSIARFHLAASPLGNFLNFTDFSDAHQASELSLTLRRKVFEFGLGEVISNLVAPLKTTISGYELKRLNQLVELAFSFERRLSLRLSDFVKFVKHTPVESSSAGMVKVMTIHKSKGLEFDTVILPQLDIGVEKIQAPKVLFERDFQSGRIIRVIRYPNKVLCALDPRLERLAEISKQRQIEDELSVLYVALTRAKKSLYLLAEKREAESEKGDKGPEKSFAGILREAQVLGLLKKNR